MTGKIPSYRDLLDRIDNLKSQFVKARDLASALREIAAMCSGGSHIEKRILARIDAALSSASGDNARLKGDPDVDNYIRKEREKRESILKGLHDYPIEGGSPPAVSVEATTRKPIREEVMRLMREDFDPTPAGWEGRDWNDNAEDVADKIMALLSQSVGVSGYACKARAQGTAGGNDPADCDWPQCGCDPGANKVLASIDEQGFEIVRKSAASGEAAGGDGISDERVNRINEYQLALDAAASRPAPSEANLDQARKDVRNEHALPSHDGTIAELLAYAQRQVDGFGNVYFKPNEWTVIADAIELFDANADEQTFDNDQLRADRIPRRLENNNGRL